MRNIEDLREYFLLRLRHALKHPSMWGGESFIGDYLSHLTFIDNTEQVLGREMEKLRESGTFNARAVAGAFSRIIGTFDSGSGEVASVYAEIASRMGYLDLARKLGTKEFEQMKKGLRKKCREQDLTADGVKREFGEPSWSTGSNPLFPCVFAYASEEATTGWGFFDFWNEIKMSEENRVEGKYGPVPQLRNIRAPAEDFARSFTFTPFGKRLLAKRQGEDSCVESK